MPLHHQLGSIAAWNDETHVQANRQLYRDKFAAVLAEFDGKLAVAAPDAGFYLWPRNAGQRYRICPPTVRRRKRHRAAGQLPGPGGRTASIPATTGCAWRWWRNLHSAWKRPSASCTAWTRCRVSTVLKAERADYILQRLQELYPQTPVPLDHRDPFTLLVAVLLSAQCTDERVNQVTPALFALADTPAAMAALEVDQIQADHPTLRSVTAEIAGPSNVSARSWSKNTAARCRRTWQALERLPGVGHKTASVVMSQAFGVPAFPVDTHIHRLAQRWGLTSGKNVVQTERDLKRLFPQRILEPPAPADYFLRPRVLHRPRLRRPSLRDLPHLLSRAQAPERRPARPEN